jgi:hypothetical protein
MSVLTADQERARRKWSAALKRRCDIADALKTTQIEDRAHAHARLDRLWDNIERIEADALELFPGVDDSFTISTFRLKL